MKKSFLLSKICGFAAVFAVILTLAACANNVPSKADVSLTIPKNVLQKVADEAAREGEVTADTLCNITCLLYVDGWAEAFNEWSAYDRKEETDENGNTYDILYDVLIKQNGDFHSDWTGVKMDLEDYKKVIFEPYDLHRIF